jgi:type VI secretion system secreted protein VgrG
MIFQAPITLHTSDKDGQSVLAKLELRSLVGTEALGQPFEFTLDLLSKSENLDIAELLGKPMTVRLELSLMKMRYFTGYVTNVSLAGSAGTYALYRVTLRPWLWLLNRTSNCKIFHGTVPDIVKEVFRGHGLTDFKESLGSYRPREFVVQYNETDFNFVSRLLEEEGIYYFFEHDETKHTLVLADSYGAHEAEPGCEELPYYPPDPHREMEMEYIDHWEVNQALVSEAFATKDFDFERPTAPLSVRRTVSGDHALKDSELFDYPAGYLYPKKDEEEYQSQDHETPRDAYVRLAMEEIHASYERIEAQSNARGLKVGRLFKLTEFPRDDQLGEYLIVAASYELQAHSLESTSTPGEQVYRCSFTAMDSARTFRPPRMAMKPVIRGPQTALVVGKDKEEIWTDEHGRVKVQFHWDRLGKFNEESSCWVRVSQYWAGGNWGSIHIPRMGQEVIVDFIEGDPDRPIITGRVYNSDNKPPYTLPANQTQSGIKSRSSKEGTDKNFNEIRFEDKKGEEELHVQAEKDHTTLVKHNQTTTVNVNRSASVGGNDSVSVTGDRAVTVHGNVTMKVEGTGKSPVHSETTITGKHALHASDTIEYDAPTHIQFKVGDSIILMEPGKISITAGGKATVVLDANVFAQANGKASLLLDENAFMHANGGGEVLCDANVRATSNGAAQIVLDANAGINASKGDVTIEGKNVTANGSTKVAVTGGQGNIELAAAGATMSGPKATVSGAGTTEITGAVVKIN